MQVASCWPLPPATPASQCPTRPALMIHYTYGQDYDLNGKFTPGKVCFKAQGLSAA
jgi:hypothetical protein